MGVTTVDEIDNSGSPLLVSGGGSLDELPGLVDRLGVRKSLLVVGPGVTSTAEGVQHLLGGRSTGTFTAVVAHVPSREANLAVASAQKVHASVTNSAAG